MVLRLNTLSSQVMKQEGIEVIDAYALLAAHLDLASGDNYHWQSQAYQLLSQQIAGRVLAAVGKGKWP